MYGSGARIGIVRLPAANPLAISTSFVVAVMVAVHAIVASAIVTCSTNAAETLSVSAWHYKKQKDDLKSHPSFILQYILYLKDFRFLDFLTTTETMYNLAIVSDIDEALQTMHQ